MTCAGCHGETGNSSMEGIPSLAGQPALFVTNQLILMREGVRQIEQMTSFVKDLTDSEIEALAAYYSRLVPERSAESPDPGLAREGARLAAAMRCGTCHLPTYAGQNQVPRIAKQRVDYLIAAMAAYRGNRRSGSDTSMNAVLYGVRDAEITALAHFLAGH